jgi:type II secretory pathway component PulJ
MTARSHKRGYLLIEYLLYIAVLAVVVGIAMSAFYRSLDNSRNLARTSEDILRVMRAGELWRADIRAAVAPPRAVTEENMAGCEIQTSAGWIVYMFAGGSVWRQEPDKLPKEILKRVRQSKMLEERREHVVSWRWEVELLTRKKVVKMRPLFTFFAAAKEEAP